MCDKLARVLKGTITVESKEGVCTTFRLRAPFKVDNTNPIEKEDFKDQSLSGVSIFIIDNSEKVQYSLKKRLMGWGCEVKTGD